ncbi:MAG: phosphatase PAP2 family protein, partial [Dokdonella sp.]
TLLIAASRVVLGLHYPSDVIVAMLIGFALAETSCLIVF